MPLDRGAPPQSTSQAPAMPPTPDGDPEGLQGHPPGWTHLSVEVSHEVTAPTPLAPGTLAFQLVTGSAPSAPGLTKHAPSQENGQTSVRCFSPSKWLVPPQCIPAQPAPPGPSMQAPALGLLLGTWTLKWGSLTDAPQLPLGNVREQKVHLQSSDSAAPSRPPCSQGPPPGDGSAGKLGSPGRGGLGGKQPALVSGPCPVSAELS